MAQRVTLQTYSCFSLFLPLLQGTSCGRAGSSTARRQAWRTTVEARCGDERGACAANLGNAAVLSVSHGKKRRRCVGCAAGRGGGGRWACARRAVRGVVEGGCVASAARLRVLRAHARWGSSLLRARREMVEGLFPRMILGRGVRGGLGRWGMRLRRGGTGRIDGESGGKIYRWSGDDRVACRDLTHLKNFPLKE